MVYYVSRQATNSRLRHQLEHDKEAVSLPMQLENTTHAELVQRIGNELRLGYQTSKKNARLIASCQFYCREVATNLQLSSLQLVFCKMVATYSKPVDNKF